MNVNPKTLLFENLTKQEKNELLDIATSLILEGKVPSKDNYLVRQWLNVAEIEDRDFLLNISTVFAPRALLSVI